MPDSRNQRYQELAISVINGCAGGNESKRTMEWTEQGWQTSAASGGTPGEQNSEGLQEPALESFPFENRKDPKGSSKDSFPFLNGTTLLALLLALGSSAGILGLRRVLSRQA